jgi:hypothetical protein
MAETVNVIWGNREAKYFRCDGWTGFRARCFLARRANHARAHGALNHEGLSLRTSTKIRIPLALELGHCSTQPALCIFTTAEVTPLKNVNSVAKPGLCDI